MIAPWGSPLEVVYGGQWQNGFLELRDHFAVWQHGTLVYSSLMAWTPERGVYPFITFGVDYSRGAHGLGMDETDMVWVYSEGKGYNEDPYPIRSIVTSPFTTDPGALDWRRLRSYPNPYPVIEAWSVGCGRAAHALPGTSGQVLLVRLSDGVSWTLESPKCAPPDNWCLDTVYALTCDELFLRGGRNAEVGFVRIPFDQLGPGTPPD